MKTWRWKSLESQRKCKQINIDSHFMAINKVFDLIYIFWSPCIARFIARDIFGRYREALKHCMFFYIRQINLKLAIILRFGVVVIRFQRKHYALTVENRFLDKLNAKTCGTLPIKWNWWNRKCQCCRMKIYERCENCAEHSLSGAWSWRAIRINLLRMKYSHEKAIISVEQQTNKKREKKVSLTRGKMEASIAKIRPLWCPKYEQLCAQHAIL